MNTPRTRRKIVKHYHEPGHCHELTFSCYQRLPLLNNDSWREMLSTSISRAIARHEFQLVSFVFMPEHVHLLVYPQRDTSHFGGLLRAIKRPYFFRIKQLLTESRSPLLDRLTVRQRPDVTTFRFWREGPGYDRNLWEKDAILASIDYLHENPVRRGLCQRAVDWQWSSARQYLEPSGEDDPLLPRIDRLPAEYLDAEE